MKMQQEVTPDSVQVQLNKLFAENGNNTSPIFSALVGSQIFHKMVSETSVLQAELYMTSNPDTSFLY